MSDDRREGLRGGEREGQRRDDRVDALLSADMDDALSAEERIELDTLLAQNAVSSRAQAFEKVDAALRSLAEEPVDEARIAASLETLRERLDWDAEEPVDPQVGGLRPATFLGLPLGLPLGVGLGLAAAAAAMLFFAAGAQDETQSRRGEIEDRVGETAALAEGSSDAGFEDEGMVTALGYAEWSGDLSELGLASPEDLEIVEQLELLDFLAAREAGGQG